LFPERGENLVSLPAKSRKTLLLYALAAAVSIPVGYSLFSWSVSTYSFLALYRPERLFQESGDPSEPIEHKKTEILESLNAEIEQDSQVKQTEESGLLARLDRLWNSMRKAVSSPPERGSPAPTASRKASVAESAGSKTAGTPSRQADANGQGEVLHNVLSLAADPAVIQSASEKASKTPSPSRPDYNRSILPVGTRPVHPLMKEEKAAADQLYRFEPLKGVRTNSLICRFHESLALEGTVEAPPIGETDPDLTDFGFRTVHALNFLCDRPTPAIMTGRNTVNSGYPVSYGIGLNYQISPMLNLRFDYAHESPSDYLVEYNGSWESSLVTSYSKYRPEDTPSLHSFFLGLRYLHRKNTTLVPLHTGFFYSTNMNNEPLASNVSLGFSMGGGINRRDFRMGFAYRFRIWDNPEDQFLKEQQIKELQTKVSNQFLFTVVF
jgi:hypothetical protein